MSAPLAGRPIFPVDPTTKAPKVKHGFKDATTDSARVADILRCEPGIAVATGNGLLVLDVDLHGEVDGEASLILLESENEKLPATYTVRTPSGGRHLYFEYDASEITFRSTAGRVGAGLDTRADGGYVVAPPTVGYDVLYDIDPVPVPDWLVPLAVELPPVPTKPKPARATGELLPGDDFEARTSWAELLEPEGWTLVRSNGEQNHWRRPGKSQGVSACANWRGDDLLTVFSCNAGVPADTYGRFNYLVARDFAGDHSAAARDLASKGYGKSGLRKTLTEPRRSTRPDVPFHITNIADVRSSPVHTMWGGRVVRVGCTLISGNGGIGKSTVKDALIAAVSGGNPLPGWGEGDDTPTGDCVILSYEDTAGIIRGRLGVLGADLRRVHIVEGRQLRDKDDKPVEDGNGHPVFESITAADIGTIESTIRENLPNTKLFVLDPYKNIVNGEINRPEVVAPVIGALDGMARRLEIAVVIVAHHNVSNRVAGWLGLRDTCRSAVEFHETARTDEMTTVAIIHDKCNHTAPAPSLEYEFRRLSDGRGWHTGDSPLTWLGTTTLTVGDVLRERKVSKSDQAKDWLRDRLRGGPVASADLLEDAKEDGISERTLERARKELKVERTRIADGWVVSLPRGDCPPLAA